MPNDADDINPSVSSPALSPFVLKWSTVMPDVRNANSDALRDFVSAIDKKSKGRVKAKIYWKSELGPVQDTLKMLQVGIADGAYVVMAYHKWAIPLTAAGGLPFLTTGYRIAPLALKALFDEWPTLQEEMAHAGIRPLYFSQSHEHYLGVNRPITNLDDLKGLRIWGGNYWPDMLKELGAVPMPLKTPDVLHAIQKGEIDGFITTFVQIKANKYYEYMKYLVRWPFGGAPVNPSVIRLKAWKRISPVDRKIIMDTADRVPGQIADQTDAEIDQDLKFLKHHGVQQMTLSDSEIARGIEIGKPAVFNPWIETCEKQGIAGREFLERYIDKINQVSS